MFNRLKSVFTQDRQVELVLRQILINICVELICIRNAKDVETVQSVIMSTGGVDIEKHIRKITLLNWITQHKVEIELGDITTKEYTKNLEGLEELKKDLEALLELKYGKEVSNT